MYRKTLYATWGDMDFNSHMGTAAYLHKSGDVRMMFFSENGFPMSEFLRTGIGPVIFKDQLEYFREIGLLQEIQVTLAVAGMSEDGSRWWMRNEFLRPDGKPAARVTSEGGWIDLQARRVAAPPPELLRALQQIPRTDDFQTLPSRLK